MIKESSLDQIFNNKFIALHAGFLLVLNGYKINNLILKIFKKYEINKSYSDKNLVIN